PASIWFMQTTGSRSVWVNPGFSHDASACDCQAPLAKLWQPGLGWKFAAATNAANSARVTVNLASANGLAKVTWCCGWSLFASLTEALRRSFSPGGAPIWKRPAGMITISGQFAQSRKLCGGFALAALCAGTGLGAPAVAGGGAGLGAAAGAGGAAA